MFLRSIRCRMQLWHTVLLSSLVVFLVLGFYRYERHARLREIDLRLEGILTPLLPELTQHPRPHRRGPPEANGPVPGEFPEFPPPPEFAEPPDRPPPEDRGHPRDFRHP